jgi:hypothetical protein
MEAIMAKRAASAAAAYEAMWDEGRGSHHPDFDPMAFARFACERASRQTEELYCAIVANNIAEVRSDRECFVVPNAHSVVLQVYNKISEGADVNFSFSEAYSVGL